MRQSRDHFQPRRRPRRWHSVRRLLRANSLFGLLLAGFLLVTAPLVAGLLISGLQIERVTRNSERLLDQAVTGTQAARAIQDRLTTYQRAARQFLVLHDVEARAHLLQQAEAFDAELAGLRSLTAEPALVEPLARMQTASLELLARLIEHPPTDQWPDSLARDFAALDQLTLALLAQSDAAAEQATRRLERLGDQARSGALLQLALFIPVALILALLVTALISRPIRRLDDGIRALAQPRPGPLPKVSVPRDLRALSVRLEWVRRRLARTERDRQRLLGHVSHELKTPLSAIREGVSLLDDQVFGPLGPEQAEVVAILKDNAQRLQDQIESLLRFNRLRAGHRSSEPVEVSVAALVAEVLDQHALAIAGGDIELVVAVDEPLRLRVDRDLLLTVLDNLVSNAIKYGVAGRRLGLFAERDQDELRIDVADQGPGINPKDRSRIFEPFFRAHPQRCGAVPGSGLGLAICRDLVQILGGELELAQRRGWQTVFRVRLTGAFKDEEVDTHD